jgi:hypothetical protein
MQETAPKNLQQIAREKVISSQNQPQMNPPPITQKQIESVDSDMSLNTLPDNHIVNVIKALKTKQEKAYVWFDFELPSNGKCGYPKDIKLREMTTSDEKTLIKEMFSSKENSILNVIRKCAKFESQPTFDFENLTTFDQDFILVELSAITFPGEKDINVTDENNHKLTMKLNKEDLSLTIAPFDLEYPFNVLLPASGISWFLKFTTLKTLKEIDKATKSLSADVLTRLLVSIALATEKVEIGGKPVLFDNFYEIIRLLETLLPSDLKVVIDFYNDKTGTAYGYKLSKEYYCSECGKGGQMELEPLNFFRITI